MKVYAVVKIGKDATALERIFLDKEQADQLKKELDDLSMYAAYYEVEEHEAPFVDDPGA